MPLKHSYLLKKVSIKQTIPFILLIICLSSFGQTDSIRFKLVKSLGEDLRRIYVSPELAQRMSDTISEKLLKGKYDTSLNLDEFVFEIQKDLRKISKDNHIVITPPHPQTGKPAYKPFQPKRYDKRRWKRFKKYLKARERRTNKDMFSYGDIKILPGNMGYVEIKDFSSTTYSKKENHGRIKLKSVMRFLRNTGSIIIDLRNNGGGNISQAAKFCSYFSKTPNLYLFTVKSFLRFDSAGIRKSNSFTDKMQTSAYITDKFTAGKKIFILTSNRTFSAAVTVTYKIKQLFNGPVTVIGEPTPAAGNAHKGGYNHQYYFSVIPSVRVFDEHIDSVSFIENSIVPDISTDEDSALNVAYQLALPAEYLPHNTKTKYYRKAPAQFSERESLFKERHPDYIGDYSRAIITAENGKLFMTYDSYTKLQLIPDAKDYFQAEGFEIIRFKRDSANKVKEIQIKHEDGYLEIFRRK